jgi:hypothetical protein
MKIFTVMTMDVLAGGQDFLAIFPHVMFDYQPVSTMLEFRTQGFNGYAVKYSPFFDSRIAVSAAANFGLVGNGRLYVLALTAGGIRVEKWQVGPMSGHALSRLTDEQL